MTAHQCDPHLRTTGYGPLTRSRVLRLLLTPFDDGPAEVESIAAVVLHEVKPCADCLTGMLLLMTEVAYALVPEAARRQVVVNWERQLIEALDQIGGQRPT
ncbi:hypothetical protein H7I53_14550 [Mycolicibacterium pulveris]|nr:hypothetical protein [Mycolicibacterium pulveris]MCV6981442.1 hypothetical protein [Mycolicibacterium pulveris]